jgi:hypothetical protein
MKFQNIFILICLILSACSSIHPIQHQVGHPDKVNLELPNTSNKPIEDAATKIKVEETVRVGAQGGELYTLPGNEQATIPPEERNAHIGISFGPGLNRVINYVSVLKILERHNMAPTVITGTGMGAVVAAMYAEGMTPEIIEWNFYKYFKENTNYTKPYEKEWLKGIDKFLLSKLKKSKIEETKKKFFITLYDRHLKKAFYFDHGNIRDLLLKGLYLDGNIHEDSEQKFVAVFEKEVFNAHLLNQLGADFTIAIDGLGTKFDFDHPNEFLFGVYGRTSGRIQKEKEAFDYVITLPLSKVNLDSSNAIPLSMKKTYDFMAKEIVLIKNKIQLKMDTQ